MTPRRAFVGLALLLVACSRRPAIDRLSDSYEPLSAAELAVVVAASKDVAAGLRGTENDPAPILDRPYVRFAAEIDDAKGRLRSSPASDDLREQLARIWSRAGRYDLARREYALLLAKQPEDGALHLSYAHEVWYERLDADETLRHLRAAMALGVPAARSRDLYFLLGDVAETRDHAADAERFYARVLKVEPSHAEAAYRLGVLAREKGTLDAAYQLFNRVVTNDPKHTQALFGLGQLLIERGATAQGEALLARHARLRRIEALGFLDESDAFQCIVLGNHHALAGELEPALAEFTRAVELEPDNRDARSYRAAVLLDVGRIEEALMEFKKVLARDPNHAHALTALADFHLSAGDDPRREPGRGLDLAQRAVAATAEKDARAWAALARGRAHRGDKAGALQAIDRAIDLEPDAARWKAERGRIARTGSDDG